MKKRRWRKKEMKEWMRKHQEKKLGSKKKKL